MTKKVIILGVDPSTVSTGWAILEENESTGNLMGYGTIRCSSKLPIYQRVNKIHKALLEIANKYKVTEVAVEDQFLKNNPKVLKSLSSVKGSVMIVAAEHDLPYAEYAPRAAKKVFSGTGTATKALMIETAMNKYHIEEKIRDDIADAIGIAYTHMVERVGSEGE